MNVPQGYFIIFQPKYRVPCVFDLHPRGLFRQRPFVTEASGFRVVADTRSRVKLQCAWLSRSRPSEPGSGQAPGFAVDTILLDLDKTLALDPQKLASAVPDETLRQTISHDLAAWRSTYAPENSSIPELEKKIQASIEDQKVRLRSRLVHKNHDWIMSGLARQLQDFRRNLYPLVRETLMETYQNLGGESEAARLIRHIALFIHIFDHERTDRFKPLETGEFPREDQAWECWTGFTGSEDETRRLCRTMEAVFPPLAQKTAA